VGGLVFYSRWSPWVFPSDVTPLSAFIKPGPTQSPTQMKTKEFPWEVKLRPARRAGSWAVLLVSNVKVASLSLHDLFRERFLLTHDFYHLCTNRNHFLLRYLCPDVICIRPVFFNLCSWVWKRGEGEENCFLANGYYFNIYNSRTNIFAM
jgi:hypothetical protein